MPEPTAGRSAGTEQGQGREVWRVGKHYGIHVYAGDRPVATFLDADDADLAVRAYNAGLSVPPARDSGRDEAREAVARELARHRVAGFSGTEVLCGCPGRRWRSTAEHQQHLADAVAALLRDGTTT